MSVTFHEAVAYHASRVVDGCFDEAAEPLFLDDCRDLAELITDCAEANDRDWLDIEFRDMVITRALFDDMLDVALKRQSRVIFSLDKHDLSMAAQACFDVIEMAAKYLPADLPQYRRLFEAPLRRRYHQLHAVLIEAESDNQHIEIEEAKLLSNFGDNLLVYFGESDCMKQDAHELNGSRFQRKAYDYALEEALDKAKQTFGQARRDHLERAIELTEALEFVEFSASDPKLADHFRSIVALGMREEIYIKNPVLRVIGGIEHGLYYGYKPR